MSNVLFFVSIDDGDNIEQIGTGSVCTTMGPRYYAFYEFAPTQGHQQEIKSITVAAGDEITASVSFSGGQFNLLIKDGAQSFPKHMKVPGAGRDFVDWFAERTNVGGGVPLADFRKIFFSNCSATADGVTKTIGQFAEVAPITMIDPSDGSVLAVPSPLSGNGANFSITFEDPYAASVLSDNPVAYYRLGEKGTTVAADSSPNKNNGTYENGPALGVPGLIVKTKNTAVNFFAGDVVIPDSPSLNFVSAPFTIEAWVNGTYAIQMRVFDKIQAGIGKGYGLDLANDNVRIGNSSGTRLLSAGQIRTD